MASSNSGIFFAIWSFFLRIFSFHNSKATPEPPLPSTKPENDTLSPPTIQVQAAGSSDPTPQRPPRPPRTATRLLQDDADKENISEPQPPTASALEPDPVDTDVLDIKPTRTSSVKLGYRRSSLATSQSDRFLVSPCASSTPSFSSSSPSFPAINIHCNNIELRWSPPSPISPLAYDIDGDERRMLDLENGFDQNHPPSLASTTTVAVTPTTKKVTFSPRKDSIIPGEADVVLNWIFGPAKQRHTLEAHSAVSELFWDAPRHANELKSVPLPVPSVKVQNTTNLVKQDEIESPPTRPVSSIPYPEVFDLSMYEKSSNRLTVVTPSPPAVQSSSSRQKTPIHMSYSSPSIVLQDRDRYRGAAYSRPTSAYNLSRLASRTARTAASGDVFDRVSKISTPKADLVHAQGETITSTTTSAADAVAVAAAAKSMMDMDDSSARISASLYSQNSVSSSRHSVSFDFPVGNAHDEEKSNLEDLSARLRAACEDLSRCVWTNEEFMKMFG